MFVIIVSVDHVNVQDWWGGTASWNRGVFWRVDLGDLSNKAAGVLWALLLHAEHRWRSSCLFLCSLYCPCSWNLSKQWTWIKSHSSDMSHHRDIGYLYVCIMSTSSLSQNTVQDLPRGPEPPFFNIGNMTLLPSLTADRVPVNKTFGDVLQQVRQQYRAVRASRIC